MKLSHFFISRPVFAIVISVLITLIGAVAAFNLPIAEFPEIAPPTVVVKAIYPGASAQELADTVAAPIEQELNGIDGMLYLSSQAVGDGKLSINVVLKPGTDVNQAQALIQNRVSMAESHLPDEVRRMGLSVKKSSPDQLMVVLFSSPKGSLSQQYISDFVSTRVKDKLARIEGVGDLYTRGSRDFSMRIWLDPAKVAAYGMTAAEVVASVRRANAQVAAGILNQPPYGSDGGFQVQVQAQGRLRDVEEFKSIIISASQKEGIVRLRDVARVEIGAQDYSESGFVDGKNAVAISISQKPDSNALETANRVIDQLKNLKSDLPEDLEFHTYYNPTEFIKASIDIVRDTIFEAALLVSLAVFFFLGTWRASIIPIAAIPVSLIGTFAIMAALGYSLNTFSLFGLVLAIGIVVDDAIVVVENVERHMSDGLTALEATKKSMNEVGFALIAIALVLVAVFVPTAFIEGISGTLYRQFAVTIAASTIISAFVSLTLSPALAAILLRPKSSNSYFDNTGWFAIFNKFITRISIRYGHFSGIAISKRWLMIFIYLILVALTIWRIEVTPTGFVPQLDRGYAMISVQLPPGATLTRTEDAVQKVTQLLLNHPGVAHTASFVGTDGATFTSAPNSAVIFTIFKDFEHRTDEGLDGPTMLISLRNSLAAFSDARVIVIPPPAIRGIGTGGGFKLQIRDISGQGSQALAVVAKDIADNAAKLPSVNNAFTPFDTKTPTLNLNINYAKAHLLGVNSEGINQSLQTYLGSIFVNDMNLMGRVWRVTAQADSHYRRDVNDLASLSTRSSNGKMVSLGSVATFQESTAPFRVPRYNLYPSAEVQGSTRQGYSTGETITAIEVLLKDRLPPGFDYEWTEIALQEKAAGNSAVIALALAVIFVYLLLAALFESWVLPLSVVLIVPLCVLAALLGVALRGMENNVLTQIGIIVLIGLAAKNAILIVEFARKAVFDGSSTSEAAIAAAKHRLRPILMTSLAFLMGALPLIFSSGPGSEMRQAIGTAVFSGMLGVTVFGLVFTPVLFTLFQKNKFYRSKIELPFVK